MRAADVIVLLILAVAVFLLVAGGQISTWLDQRATNQIETAAERDPEPQRLIDERAGFKKRITAERDPGRRAAWRMLRDQNREG
ncbi:hypothetical protein AB0M57_04320 [Streptomyces sp. NPDC051597]|uniref:hypothetical protein n=1 Tax=Streptomyces sp. NPDC051597 TaxID=3155049 RepID=UPI00343B7F73